MGNVEGGEWWGRRDICGERGMGNEVVGVVGGMGVECVKVLKVF